MIRTVFSRCPVGTATELIIKKGWLQKALQDCGAEFCILQSMDSAYHKAHYTQEAPLHFRDGGNIPPIWAQTQGDRSVLLGVSYQKEMRGIFVRKDSSINSMEDLKGKRLAIPVRQQAVVDFRYLTAMHGFEGVLSYFGISMNQVEIQPVMCKNIVAKMNGSMDTLGKNSDFMTEDFQAVLDGKADAAFANSVKAVRHNQAGIFRNILPEELHEKIPNVNNNAVLAITCTKPFAYNHPDIVVAYLKELIKAGGWIKNHPDEFIDVSAGGVYGAAADEMKASFDRKVLLNRIPELTDYSFELLNEQKDYMIRYNIIDKEHDFHVETWADKSFLEEAMSEMKA